MSGQSSGATSGKSIQYNSRRDCLKTVCKGDIQKIGFVQTTDSANNSIIAIVVTVLTCAIKTPQFSQIL